MPRKLRVAVGMSGGVDSGVSAKLLVDAGYDVAGVHLHFWAESVEGETRQNKCCSTESLMAARRTCDMLGIPFYTFNFEDVFKQTVVEYFLDEYRKNRTPNPCVVCNRKIKTGRLVKYVQGLGFDFLATGHYIQLVQLESSKLHTYQAPHGRGPTANESQNSKFEILSSKEIAKNNDQTQKDPNIVGGFLSKSDTFSDLDITKIGEEVMIDSRLCGNDKAFSYKEIAFDDMGARARILEEFPGHNPLFLKMGNDRKKDQSYFLYTMKQEDLVHLLFPLANMVKDQTRQLAKDWNLPVASSKESFEICFVPTDDHTEFLGRHLDKKHMQPGEVVAEDGEVVGTHRGLPFYSMGQRRGFTSRKPVPYYVVGKNIEKNQLIVGNVMNSTRSVFRLTNVTWADEGVGLPLRCEVRLRNMGSFDWGTVGFISDLRSQISDLQLQKLTTVGDDLVVVLDQSQRGISPGQSAVFYDQGVILGGGVIEEVVK